MKLEPIKKLEAIAREMPMKNSLRFGAPFDKYVVVSIVTDVVSNRVGFSAGFMTDRCRSFESVD